MKIRIKQINTQSDFLSTFSINITSNCYFLLLNILHQLCPFLLYFQMHQRVLSILYYIQNMKFKYLHKLILLFLIFSAALGSPNLQTSQSWDEQAEPSLQHRLLQQNDEQDDEQFDAQFQEFDDNPTFNNADGNSELQFGTFEDDEQNQPSPPVGKQGGSGSQQGNPQQRNPQQRNPQQQGNPQQQRNPQQRNPQQRNPQPSSSQRRPTQSNPQNYDLVPAKKTPPKILVSEIGKPILGKSFKVDHGISYQRIHITKVDLKYLFFDFKLSESDKWQQANLTISIQGSEQPIAQCKFDGYDSCYLTTDRLQDNITLFVVVKCQDQCRYMLNSRWSNLEHLRPGDDYPFKFGKEKFQLYHVQLEDQEFQEFRVHVAPRVTNRPFQNIKIYGKWQKNSSPSSEDYDFQSINLWEDGQGLFLKSDKMKSKSFTLLLVGQTQTTYRLTCELITNHNHQIEDGQHIYEYLEAGDSKSYHIEQFDTKRSQEFSLRVSVLSGYVQIRYYYDKQLTKLLPMEPFRYMDDSEYVFDAKQLAQLATTGVYIKITSQPEENGRKARDATYTIKFNGRKKAEGIELNEHVYGFIPLQQSRFAYFNFKRWIYETERQANLIFTANLLQVLGDTKAEFFLCDRSEVKMCTDQKSLQNNTLPIRVLKQQKIGEKNVFSLEIDQSTLQKINIVEKSGNIIVKLTAVKASSNSLGYNLVAIEMLNKNKVQYLREDRPLEQKLSEGEAKLYKYINSDKGVREIRIHINEVAGVVKIGGAITNKDDHQNSIQVRPEGHTLRFTKNLTQPIIVSVRADTKAIFAITMQIILKNQMHQNADMIAIGQDLTYTVRIRPQTYTIFQITPMYYQFEFSYEASQSVIACALNPQTGNCVNATDASTAPRLSYKGNITKIQMSQDRRAKVKITNPFPDSTAEVSVIFHSRKFDHCEKKQVGKVYSQSVSNGTCYSYLIQEQIDTGLELYISKRQFANMQYSVFICGNRIANVQRLKTLTLKPEVISQHCQNSIQAQDVKIQWLVNTNNIGYQDHEVKVDFVLQKLGGIVMLPEGLSYSMIGKAKEGLLKVFGFSLINKKQTRVYIRQLIGSFKGYAKVIREEDRDVAQIGEISYQVASYNTVDYSQDPVIVVTKEMISESGCLSCVLLIAVYTLDEPGRTVQFQIEAVQKYQSLSDSGSVTGYLEKDSVAYYNYIAKPDPTTLIFFLSDHNQRCANMYLSLTQNPGPKNKLTAVFQTNELIFTHNGGSAKYFIAVEATKTCDYAISVLQLDSSIHRLERGKQNMLKLQKGETRFFTFEHYINQPFKIISLSKFGQVKLYLNQSSQTPNKKTWAVNQLNYQNFAVKSEQSNTLSLNPKDKQYCVNCDYFVAAQALSATFSTIYLVYPRTVVPLLKNKFFTDFFEKKNQRTLASYTNIEKTKISVTVHSGQLEITAVYKDILKTSQNFKSRQGQQTMIIDIRQSSGVKQKQPEGQPVPSKNDPYFEKMRQERARGFKEHVPVNFIFKALSDRTSYTLEIKSAAKSGQFSGQYAEYKNIVAGQPNPVNITSSKILCIDGYLRESNEEILITTNHDNKEYLSKIIFDAKLRANKTEVLPSIVGNIISLKLVDKNAKDLKPFANNNYEICMKVDIEKEKKSEEQKEKDMSERDKEQVVKEQAKKNETEFDDDNEVTIQAIVSQINSVNILPSDTNNIVRGNSTFVIHSDGQFILDVFSCKTDAKLRLGSSMKKLEEAKLKSLESMGSTSEQKHAVKVSESAMTFINIKSEHSIVRWLPLNYQTDEGTGYNKFQSGDILYSSRFKNVEVQYQPLQKTKSTKSQISSIQYYLYVSDDAQKLDYAVECSPIATESVKVIDLGTLPFKYEREQQRKYESYNLDKNYLKKAFGSSQNIYINIVAKLELKLNKKVEKDKRFVNQLQEQHQHYQFIYNRQQMPLANYQPNRLEQTPYSLIILIFVGIIVVLVLFTCLFTRKIAPMIAKISKNQMVEEYPDPEPQNDMEEVPPSSDRNQRAPDMQMGTEEGMK